MKNFYSVDKFWFSWNYFSFTFELTKPLRKSVFSFLVWNCLFPFVQRIFWYFKLLFVELDFGKSPQTFSGALAGVSLKAQSWRDFWIRLRRIFPISKYCQIFLKILFHVSFLSWSLTQPVHLKICNLTFVWKFVAKVSMHCDIASIAPGDTS